MRDNRKTLLLSLLFMTKQRVLDIYLKNNCDKPTLATFWKDYRHRHEYWEVGVYVGEQDE